MTARRLRFLSIKLSRIQSITSEIHNAGDGDDERMKQRTETKITRYEKVNIYNKWIQWNENRFPIFVQCNHFTCINVKVIYNQMKRTRWTSAAEEKLYMQQKLATDNEQGEHKNTVNWQFIVTILFGAHTHTRARTWTHARIFKWHKAKNEIKSTLTTNKIVLLLVF